MWFVQKVFPISRCRFRVLINGLRRQSPTDARRLSRLSRSCHQIVRPTVPALTRPQKITLGEIRAAGVRGLLICCSGARSVKGQMLHLFRRTLPSVYLTRSVLDLVGKREKSRGQFAVECLGSQAAQFDNVALDQG
jgi:hypothetical protein